MPQLHAVPQRPPLVTDIRFTNDQIQRAKLAGIDTSAWQIDTELQQNRPDPKGSQAFASNWPNPSSYPG